MTPEDLLKVKRVQYGDIWECPHAEMLIAARMLDKTRRLTQLAYLRQVLVDFGDIEGVRDRIGNLDEIKEDTLADLKNYMRLLEEGPPEKKIADDRLYNAGMSYRHDFGLLSEDEQKRVMDDAQKWLNILQKESRK